MTIHTYNLVKVCSLKQFLLRSTAEDELDALTYSYYFLRRQGSSGSDRAAQAQGQASGDTSPSASGGQGAVLRQERGHRVRGR